MNHYHDYFWKNGRPQGRGRLCVNPSLEEGSTTRSYRICTDPYHKRYSVELYQGTTLKQVVYDSLLLDFRRLNLSDQQGWQRECIRQEEMRSVFWIRNQEDRAILREKLDFEGPFCRRCRIYGPQGLLLATQTMYYTLLNDTWNGTLLHDRHNHLVLAKRYRANAEGAFEELIEERSDLSTLDFLERWKEPTAVTTNSET